MKRIEANDPASQSADLVSENVEQLKALHRNATALPGRQRSLWKIGQRLRWVSDLITAPAQGGTRSRDEKKRRNQSAAYKAKVALAALKGDKTLAELSQQFDVHVNQITQWKSQLPGPSV